MLIPTVQIPADNRAGYKIVNADDPRALALAGPGEFTREGIDTMAKADVAELLSAHGVEFDGRAKLDTLRALLKSTMFMEV